MTFQPLDELRAIRDRDDLDLEEQSILSAIVLRMNPRREEWPEHVRRVAGDAVAVAWQGYAKLAEDARVSVSTAKRKVKVLEKRGLLRVLRSRIPGSKESEGNVYSVSLEVVSGRHHVVSARHDVVSGGHEGGVSETPQVVSGGHQGGVWGTPKLHSELHNGTAHRRERPALARVEPAKSLSLEGKESEKEPSPAATPLAAPKPAPSVGKPKRVKTFVPGSDASPEEVAAFCAKWGITFTPDKSTEVAKMFDHFRANGEAKADWGATWRNWMRRAPQFAAKGNGAHMVQPGPADGEKARWKLRQERQRAAGEPGSP